MPLHDDNLPEYVIEAPLKEFHKRVNERPEELAALVAETKQEGVVMPIQQRHIKAFVIPSVMLEELMHEGVTFRCVRGIPEGATIRLIKEAPEYDGFVIGVEHPSFPPIDLGTKPAYEWIVLEAITDKASQ